MGTRPTEQADVPLLQHIYTVDTFCEKAPYVRVWPERCLSSELPAEARAGPPAAVRHTEALACMTASCARRSTMASLHASSTPAHPVCSYRIDS